MVSVREFIVYTYRKLKIAVLVPSGKSRHSALMLLSSPFSQSDRVIGSPDVSPVGPPLQVS